MGDRLFDIEEAKFGGSDLHAPYVHLKEVLESYGVDVHTVDFLPEENETNSVKIFVGLTNFNGYRKLARRSDVIMSAFIAMECPVVDPYLYRKLPTLQRSFKRIVSWTDSASLLPFTHKSVPVESFAWPQSFDDVDELHWQRGDRKFLLMMNSNKLPSLYHKELYTERLRAIEHFSRTDDIDLYGGGWEKASHRLGMTWLPWTIRRARIAWFEWLDRIRPDPRLVAARKVYKGKAESKKETLSDYTFAICFENSIVNYYMTEKMFDCFHTGTIPIYLGDPKVTERVPANCFIDMRNFEDYEALRTYLRSMSEETIHAYKIAGRNFLRSPQYYPFSRASFTDMFIRIIEEDAGVQLRS